MLSPNTLLQNRYRIIQRIGQGGMGTVYEARHEELGNSVAIKETFHTEDDGLRRAFKREARMLAGLQHSSLPRVIDYFAENDGLFLVMEYIAGDDLLKLLTIRQQPFSLMEVLRWADQLLDVLEYLHSQTPPVIHRDIKPNNIKCNKRGDAILLDFGLAKGTAIETSSIIASQSVFGFTRGYAPLEQILKADANWVQHLGVIDPQKVNRILQTSTDARSDLYALGATLLHLLTNKEPAQAPTRALALWSGKPDPLLLTNKLGSQVPLAVANVLQKIMALESERRPSSAIEVRRLLSEPTQFISENSRGNIEPKSTINTPQTNLNFIEIPTKIRAKTIDTPKQTQQSPKYIENKKKATVINQQEFSPLSNWQIESKRVNQLVKASFTYILPIFAAVFGVFLVWNFFGDLTENSFTQISSIIALPIGALLLFIGGIWQVILSIQTGKTTGEKILWALVTFSCQPIGGIVFFIVKRIGLVPLILVIIGALLYGVGSATSMNEMQQMPR